VNEIQSEELPREILILRDYFATMLEKCNHGLVTVIALPDCVIAGVGTVPFQEVRFSSTEIGIRAQHPLERGTCLRLHNRRKKASVRRKELLSGLSRSFRLFWDSIPCGKVSFEIAEPDSLHAAEYHARKIISIVRRQLEVTDHIVRVKKNANLTCPVVCATQEWEKNKPRFL
jgi:hypothetical protein